MRKAPFLTLAILVGLTVGTFWTLPAEAG